MNIKDYLPLYLGCEVDNGETLIAADIDGNIETLFRGHLINYYTYDQANGFKLKLRPLSSMDKKLFNKLTGLEYWNDVPNDIDGWFGARAKMIKELLDEHFDLFGLIDAGLAIDKTVGERDIEYVSAVKSDAKNRSNIIGDVDFILAGLEDYTHGEDGKKITQARHLLKQLL